MKSLGRVSKNLIPPPSQSVKKGIKRKKIPFRIDSLTLIVRETVLKSGNEKRDKIKELIISV